MPNVVNVRDGTISAGVTVVVRDGMIVSVGDDSPPRGADTIDLLGRYITPGLFEGHFHGGNIGAAQRALVSGVTTAKGASVGGYTDVALKEMVRDGYLVGPDILAAGIYVTPGARQYQCHSGRSQAEEVCKQGTPWRSSVARRGFDQRR